MDTIQDFLTNDEVMETATEEIAEVASENGVNGLAWTGLGVVIGLVAYKYVVNPLVAKYKAKKEAQMLAQEEINFGKENKDESDET